MVGVGDCAFFPFGGAPAVGDFLFNLGARLGILGGGVDLEAFHELVIGLAHGGRQLHGEGRAWHVEHHDFADGGIVRGLGEILSGENGGEGLDHEIGVGDADATADDRADVPEEGFADFVGELGHELVSDDEVEAVLAGLGENRLEGVGGEVLELVDVEAEILALFLWDILAAHGGLLEFHDEDHAEKVGVNVAEAALAEVDEEDFVVVHDLADVEAGFDLTEGVSHNGVAKEGAPLAGKPSGNLAGVGGLLRLGEFLGPIIVDGFVGDVFKLRLHEFGIGETLGDVDEGGTMRVRHKEERGVTEHVLATGAEEALVIGVEEGLEHANALLDDEILLVGVGELEHVHANGVLDVGGVEVDDVIHALFGDAFQEGFDSVAMGVDESEAAAVAHVLEGEVLEENGLTHTSLADDVHVAAAIVGREVDWLFDAAEFVGAEEEAAVGDLGGAVDLLGELTFDAGAGNGVLLGEMKDSGKLNGVQNIAAVSEIEEAERVVNDEVFGAFDEVNAKAVQLGGVELGEGGNDATDDCLGARLAVAAGDDADQGFKGGVADLVGDRGEFFLLDVGDGIFVFLFFVSFGRLERRANNVEEEIAGGATKTAGRLAALHVLHVLFGFV